MRAGLSLEFSVPFSGLTDTGHRMRCGLTTRVEPILIHYDKLRYRLMPYVYSLAWRVTSQVYACYKAAHHGVAHRSENLEYWRSVIVGALNCGGTRNETE